MNTHSRTTRSSRHPGVVSRNRTDGVGEQHETRRREDVRVVSSNDSKESGSTSISTGMEKYLEEAILSRISQERRSGPACDEPIAKGEGEAVGESRSLKNGGAPARTIPVWKRLFDLTVICLTLPVWLPVMVLIMLLIKLVSPGPAFYRQRRVGLGGRSFMIFKFRSMRVNAETGCHQNHLELLMQGERPMTKLDAIGDPRLIPLGKFFRASGLDELPQIFNVIQGDMSLVGPRPCTFPEFELYEPWQKERFNAVPGLTGFWQVNGKNTTTFNEMIAMDIQYSKTLSLRGDLAILLKTFPVIFSQIEQSQKPREHRPMNSETLRPIPLKQS